MDVSSRETRIRDQIFNKPRSDPRRDVFAEVERLGLHQNVLNLEEYGYTVIERVLDEGTLERARHAILNQLERKHGSRPDLDTFEGQLPLGHFLLFEDPVFEEILMNEKLLALATYLLGQSFARRFTREDNLAARRMYEERARLFCC